MSGALAILEAKCAELNEVFKKQSEFLNQTSTAIRQLRAERKRALAQVNETSGALQAYTSTVNLLKGEQPNPVEPVPACEPEVVDVEGEIVPQATADVPQEGAVVN